jgi:ATP-dependent 26S proteasome regulatory subunit
MSTFPEGGWLGDPRYADRDGMLHRDPTPQEKVESQLPIEEPMGLIERHNSGIFFDCQLISEKHPNIDFLPLVPALERELRVHGLSKKEEEPIVDGSDYTKDAFGGFGPGSPEYDSGRRLKIAVPNAKAAVAWFKETDIEDVQGSTPTTKLFSTSIASVQHPGVACVEVKFIKSGETSLISGQVTGHYGAWTVPGAPKVDKQGVRIDTNTPARRMMADHVQARIESLYPGKTGRSKDTNQAVIEVSDGINLHIDYSRLPRLEVTANGSTPLHEPVRHESTDPSPKQLVMELKAIQDHFPIIAEAYADFFRKQLPESQITVDYKSTESSSAGPGPVNPERLAMLRQELVTEPREDDFKYIGGLDGDIAKLKEAAMGFSHPEAFREFGVSPPRGILLQGPPGTGKTSLAMAFARDTEAVVLTLKASTIKSAFHGETERNIRGAFQLADELVEEGEKVVIFIDEIESLAPARDSFDSSTIDKNVTTELLQNMNVDRKDCIIIAATNVPGMVDRALINNSSRFSQQLEIGLPDAEARTDIIEKLFLKFADKSTSGSHEALFSPEIRIDTLAQSSEGLSGADIENAIRKVLFTKAVMLASTGQKPGPALNGEIYQSLKNVSLGKEKTDQNYL